jgi:hypothetical protein
MNSNGAALELGIGTPGGGVQAVEVMSSVFTSGPRW